MDIEVDPHTTSVEALRACMQDLEMMLQSRHMGLTSHEEYHGGCQHDNQFFFVSMDGLFRIRLYTFTDELDAKKHALIKSEVWLAAMEILEDHHIHIKEEKQQQQEHGSWLWSSSSPTPPPSSSPLSSSEHAGSSLKLRTTNLEEREDNGLYTAEFGLLTGTTTLS
jgi:hypothetical protein